MISSTRTRMMVAEKYGSQELTRLDFPESVDESVWESLEFGKDVTGSLKGYLLAVSGRYPGVFPVEGNQLGFCPLAEHRINTGDAFPIRENLRPFSFWKEIGRQMKDLLRLGVVRPSESEWAANVLLVKKKGNSWRMAVDSRPLNKVTVKNNYPMGKHSEQLGFSLWRSVVYNLRFIIWIPPCSHSRRRQMQNSFSGSRLSRFYRRFVGI